MFIKKKNAILYMAPVLTLAIILIVIFAFAVVVSNYAPISKIFNGAQQGSIIPDDSPLMVLGKSYDSSPLMTLGKISPLDASPLMTLNKVVVDASPLMTLGKVVSDASPLMTLGKTQDSSPLMTEGKIIVEASPLMTLGKVSDASPLMTMGKVSDASPLMNILKGDASPLMTLGKITTTQTTTSSCSLSCPSGSQCYSYYMDTATGKTCCGGCHSITTTTTGTYPTTSTPTTTTIVTPQLTVSNYLCDSGVKSCHMSYSNSLNEEGIFVLYLLRGQTLIQETSGRVGTGSGTFSAPPFSCGPLAAGQYKVLFQVFRNSDQTYQNPVLSSSQVNIVQCP
jgi:hypothetical protein